MARSSRLQVQQYIADGRQLVVIRSDQITRLLQPLITSTPHHSLLLMLRLRLAPSTTSIA